MHRKSATHDLRDDLKGLVDSVAPSVEAAVHTVAEKAPPLLEKGRTVAVERGSQLAGRGVQLAGTLGENLGERLPDNVVDRLPDRVVDHLPVKRRRRGRKLLLIGGLAAVAAAAAYVARKAQGGDAGHEAAYPRPVPAQDGPVSTGPTSATTTDPIAEGDPSDPLVEPRLNGRTE